ncbi:MAG: sodium:solute symporter, partial [Bacteroidetes bacterium SW_10_40_5]
YAPAIILSHIMGISLTMTILLIGGLVIIYTVSGGTKAVSQTHKQQMFVIFLGMFIAFGMLIAYITDFISFGNAVQVAGKLDKLEVIDPSFDLSNRYNIWSGILGGLFLQLSYFGTDQSQVQRYLSGQSIKQSRLGLLLNGLVKIPMQFFILFTGVMVFMFYQFHQPPVYFNQASLQKVETSEYADQLEEVKDKHTANFKAKKAEIKALSQALENDASKEVIQERTKAVKSHLSKNEEYEEAVANLIQKADPDAKVENDDYVFLSYVVNYLPVGIVGLLLAVIFSAAMSSTAAELNALASTTTVDLYKRNIGGQKSERHYLQASRLFTMLFGFFAIAFAMLASLFENLIEAINILGSLFYGTILGIFLTAFFIKKVKANAVFIAALAAEATVLLFYYFSDVEYLWFNLIGGLLVVILSLSLSQFMKDDPKQS